MQVSSRRTSARRTRLIALSVRLWRWVYRRALAKGANRYESQEEELENRHHAHIAAKSQLGMMLQVEQASSVDAE